MRERAAFAVWRLGPGECQKAPKVVANSYFSCVLRFTLWVNVNQRTQLSLILDSACCVNVNRRRLLQISVAISVAPAWTTWLQIFGPYGGTCVVLYTLVRPYLGFLTTGNGRKENKRSTKSHSHSLMLKVSTTRKYCLHWLSLPLWYSQYPKVK